MFCSNELLTFCWGRCAIDWTVDNTFAFKVPAIANAFQSRRICKFKSCNPFQSEKWKIKYSVNVAVFNLSKWPFLMFFLARSKRDLCLFSIFVPVWKHTHTKWIIQRDSSQATNATCSFPQPYPLLFPCLLCCCVHRKRQPSARRHCTLSMKRKISQICRQPWNVYMHV